MKKSFTNKIYFAGDRDKLYEVSYYSIDNCPIHWLGVYNVELSMYV